MPAYAVERDQFAGLNAQVVGISVDSIFSHIAWQKKDIGLLNYPLCSDFYPHAGVIQQYGLLREGPPLPGISELLKNSRAAEHSPRASNSRPSLNRTRA